MSKPEPYADKQVRFRNGEEQFVAAGRIIDEGVAARAGAVDCIKYGVIQAVLEDEHLRTSLTGVEVVISFARVPLAAQDKSRCVREIVQYFRRPKSQLARAVKKIVATNLSAAGR